MYREKWRRIMAEPLYKRAEIKKFLDDRVKELKEYSTDEYNTLVRDGELQNEIFNTDYYIIGRYEAQKWLGDQVFDIIDIIQEYEKDNFGEVTTDITEPEKVVNMYVYIVGEELINTDPRYDYTPD